jgi:hypothetical protein
MSDRPVGKPRVAFFSTTFSYNILSLRMRRNWSCAGEGVLIDPNITFVLKLEMFRVVVVLPSHQDTRVQETWKESRNMRAPWEGWTVVGENRMTGLLICIIGLIVERHGSHRTYFVTCVKSSIYTLLPVLNQYVKPILYRYERPSFLLHTFPNAPRVLALSSPLREQE